MLPRRQSKGWGRLLAAMAFNAWTVQQLADAYRDKYGVDPPPAVLNAMGQAAWATTRRHKASRRGSSARSSSPPATPCKD